MRTPRSILASAVVAVAAGSSGLACAANSIELLFNGVPAANTSTLPAVASVAAWCGGICFPTTQFPVFDAATGRKKGDAHIWGRPFAFGAGGSLCFSEFIALSLDEGDIYMASPTNGTCGAPIDPSLKPPKYPELGAQVVIAGGGDGTIIGGTRRFANWTGTFTDRVFVGFGPATAGVGGIVYYDQLWFSITGK